jgi:predicted AlkP superfamily pyrophosphatase or phosphodiesterase
VDTALGQLLAGLQARGLDDRVNLVIAADHGMIHTDAQHIVYLDDHLDATQIDPIWTGAYAAFDALPGGLAQADALLGKHEHFECMTREQIPPRLAYGQHRRVPRYHCMASPGWQLTTRDAFQRKGHALLGEHGYDNALAQMHSPFIAFGPAFKRGHVIDGIDNVDVYPLLAHLLGITPADNDGDLQHTRDALIPAKEAH